MQKFFRVLAAYLAAFSCVVFMLAGYAHFAIPDRITTVNERNLKNSKVFQIDATQKSKTAGTDIEDETAKDYEVNVSLFKIIPLKKTKVTAEKRRYVTLCGTVYGIKLYSNGVVVISTENIETVTGIKSPGEAAGIKPGDIIKKINNKKVNLNKEVSEICKRSNGKELKFTIERKGKTITLTLKPVKEKISGDFKAGLWVRDSTAGIGTMTFYDRETGIFASLGHAVCDIDTGITLPLSMGTAMKAKILGCVSGTDSDAGELRGAFMHESIGELYLNSEHGVYGKLLDYDRSAQLIPVATSSEVRTGKVKILCSVNDKGPQYYDAEITKIIDKDSHEKNMTVKITDKKLLGITGGIVQGMSGTPLIQNGMFVGAITHVFVGNPEEGYAIFAENMVAVADETEARFYEKKAS